MSIGSLKTILDTVTDKLQSMVERGRDGRGWIMRQLLPRYKEYQQLRWASEDNGQWPALTSVDYMKWKKRKFSSAIGQGERMMIASGELLQSALIEPGHHGMAIAESSSLVVMISNELDYAGFANEKRNFTEFDSVWVSDVMHDFASYMISGGEA